MKKLLAIIVLGLFLFPNYLLAFCSEPMMAPSPPSSYSKPYKPDVPFCVNEFNNTHTCDEWTISSYNSDLENYRYQLQNYQRELQDYAEEASSFVEQAIDYANCEIRSLN
ncbi:hypothetical protein OAL89_01685 [Pelagibacteraceae bacterium]|jgi:hypothetical protein|nr:hypothetical protein [Pelagibacteraceae bacterium]